MLILMVVPPYGMAEMVGGKQMRDKVKIKAWTIEAEIIGIRSILLLALAAPCATFIWFWAGSW